MAEKEIEKLKKRWGIFKKKEAEEQKETIDHFKRQEISLRVILITILCVFFAISYYSQSKSFDGLHAILDQFMYSIKNKTPLVGITKE